MRNTETETRNTHIVIHNVCLERRSFRQPYLNFETAVEKKLL